MRETSNLSQDQSGDFDREYTSSKSGVRTVSQIFQEILDHLAEIIRSEIRLARVELGQDLAQVANAGVFLVLGAVFALYAFGFVLLGLVYALGSTIAPWLAAVIVGAGVGLIGAILLMVGRAKIKRADLKPDKTIRSVQENVTWMKKQIG